MTQSQGILKVVKPEGITSFKVLSYYKKLLNTQKIGHTGTLDKFASGLMIVTVGRATRLSQWITLQDKVYECEITFGKETATLDPEGEVIKEGPEPDYSRLGEVIDRFVGEQDQVPPNYSAIHVNGKRAYERVLAGEDLKMDARKIHIYSIAILSKDSSHLSLRVHCGKGTYIRSLARDLAYALGTVGYVSKLSRTEVGGLTVKGAHNQVDESPLEFLSLDELVAILGRPSLLRVDSQIAAKVKNGQDVSEYCHVDQSKPLLLVDDRGQLVAVMSYKNSKWSSDCVLI